jgi:K(+)-stimulated pyrophosphate-energized sodium pump
VLIAPAVVQFEFGDGENNLVRVAIALAAVAVIATAIIVAKRRSNAIEASPADEGELVA